MINVALAEAREAVRNLGARFLMYVAPNELIDNKLKFSIYVDHDMQVSIAIKRYEIKFPFSLRCCQ